MLPLDLQHMCPTCWTVVTHHYSPRDTSRQTILVCPILSPSLSNPNSLHLDEHTTKLPLPRTSRGKFLQNLPSSSFTPRGQLAATPGQSTSCRPPRPPPTFPIQGCSSFTHSLRPCWSPCSLLHLPPEGIPSNTNLTL